MTYRLPTLTSSSPTPRVRLEEVTASQLEISSLTSPFRGSREANSRLSVRDPRCTLDRSLRTLHWSTLSIPFLKMIQLWFEPRPAPRRRVTYNRALMCCM